MAVCAPVVAAVVVCTAETADCDGLIHGGVGTHVAVIAQMCTGCTQVVSKVSQEDEVQKTKTGLEAFSPVSTIT